MTSTTARLGIGTAALAAAAVGLGVAPREGTDVSTLPDPLPLKVVLADHRAGGDSNFVYPWC